MGEMEIMKGSSDVGGKSDKMTSRQKEFMQ